MTPIQRFLLITFFCLVSFSCHSQTVKINPGANNIIPSAPSAKPVVESQLAIHPANNNYMLATAMISNDITKFNDYHIAVWATKDAGNSWKQTDFDIELAADPWVIISKQGKAIAAMMGKKNEKFGVYYYISENGGFTWSNSPGYIQLSDYPTLTLSADGNDIWLTASLFERDSANKTNPDAALAYVYMNKLSADNEFSNPIKIPRKDYDINALSSVVLTDGTIVSSFIDLNPSGDPQKALAKSPAWSITSVYAVVGCVTN